MNVELNRVFDAPRDQVWAAWTDPEQVAEWWGPHQFRVPVESIDIDMRAGGRYHLTMVDNSSGNEFPTHFAITEVREAELLVMTSPAQPEFGLDHEMTTRVEFADENGGTRVSVVSGPYTEQMGPNAQKGWEQQLERLDSLLVGVPADQR